MVVIGMLTPDVHHGIGGAGAAQSAASRLVTLAAIQAGLWHRLEPLRKRRHARHQRQPRGAVDHRAAVDRTRFEQGDRYRGIFGQASRQNATGRSAAHHDVIKTGWIHVLPL